MLWTFLVVTVVLSYVFLLLIPKRVILLQKLRQFKSPPSLPLLGHALDLNVHKREILNVLKRWIDKYGRRYVIFIGIQPYFIFSEAKDVEKILSSQSEITKSSDYDVLQPWLGLGLLTSGGSKWFHRRKQLTPAFHFKILEDFLKVFNEQCKIFRQVLISKRNERFDIFPTITHCALDIICESAMGRKIDAQKQTNSDYVNAIYRLTELVQYRQLRPWFHPDFTWKLSSFGREETKCLKILHDFTDGVIKERKIERKEQKKTEKGNSDSKTQEKNEDIYMGSGKKRLAFLDLLLEAQDTDPTLNDKNIREETDTFMFEGHDTTSAAVGWSTLLLACNPGIQAKVHEELDSIFGEDRTRAVTMNDLTHMKYLECCIKESLRLYPSVPFVARKLLNDLDLDDGSTAPSGCTVFVFFYHLHRDPKVFPEPENFDPDRFLPDNSVGRHPYAYAPFSAGPRNCIGQKFATMEEKVMLSTIFRNFKVKAAVNREDVEVLCELITRPEDGIHVILEQR